MQTRVVPGAQVDKWQATLEGLEADYRQVLSMEVEEKVLRKAEMEAQKAANMIEHEAEIYARPARTWFQSEKEKRSIRKQVCGFDLAACARTCPHACAHPAGGRGGRGRLGPRLERGRGGRGGGRPPQQGGQGPGEAGAQGVGRDSSGTRLCLSYLCLSYLCLACLAYLCLAYLCLACLCLACLCLWLGTLSGRRVPPTQRKRAEEAAEEERTGRKKRKKTEAQLEMERAKGMARGLKSAQRGLREQGLSGGQAAKLLAAQARKDQEQAGGKRRKALFSGDGTGRQRKEEGPSKVYAGGARSQEARQEDKGLSKAAKVKISRGGKGKASFKSKSRFRRR